MAIKLKIAKGDSVQVITGSDKGKKGSVLAVDPKALKIKVEGIKMMTHFDQKKGIFKEEGYLDYSNVKLIEKKASSVKSSSRK